jgi:hypothetical protein
MAEMILGRVYRANVIAPDRMKQFTATGLEILNALRPADARRLNPITETGDDHDAQTELAD